MYMAQLPIVIVGIAALPCGTPSTNSVAPVAFRDTANVCQLFKLAAAASCTVFQDQFGFSAETVL